MENQDTNKSLFDISIDDNVKQSLRGAANWGGIAAIFSITGAALGVISYFVTKNRTVSTYRYEGFRDVQYESQRADNLLTIVISLIIYGFLFYFLNRFAKLTKSGIDGNNPQLISEGLGNLGSYFKMIGVLVIIFIVLIILMILIGIAGGAGS